jgi:DNA-binding MarR family transcriptional regulator
MLLATSPCTQGFLAKQLDVKPACQTVTKNALLKVGLVYQQKTGTKIFLSLTEKGRELIGLIYGYSLEDVAAAQR